jgi:predicted dinucleotide-binding enzyme
VLNTVVTMAPCRSTSIPTLTKLAAETGAKLVNVKEAAHAGDVVVVTIPEKNISSLPADLFKDVPASVVVIDTGNYYPRQRDGRIEAIENGMCESQWVAQQLGRPVITAFNNIYAARLQNFGLPAGTTGRVAIPVARSHTRYSGQLQGGNPRIFQRALGT